MRQASFFLNLLNEWAKLLRWNKPSGRLILLIPAGWALWLTPTAPPEPDLVVLIIVGGLFISGAGCIANDLWDRKFDSKVSRTTNRPLARRTIRISTAFGLLFAMLLLSLLVVTLLPKESRFLCLCLALLALPPILIYPSAKRWCKYPQAFLAICWGFAVLIPWAASQASISGNLALFFCWIATLFWTFGFDTVYAIADKTDDENLGLNSSVLSLGRKVHLAVSISYGLSSISIAIAAFYAKIGLAFWPTWLIATIGMQQEVWKLNSSNYSLAKYGKHFQRQVLLGGLILLGLIIDGF